MTLPTPIVLDCDPGHDDAMAILLAAAHPAIELLGITSPLSAVELIANLVRTCDRKVTLIPTGPLTNIAMFLQAHPELHDRIEHISFMGGSTDRGNWTPYAEFNIWADPEAADIVLRSGLPLIMSGLNITHQALATSEVLDRITKLDTKLAHTIVDLLKFFADTYRDVFGMPDPPVHDPVALAIIIDKTVAKLVSAPVSVELTGELTRGATVVDLHGTTGQKANVDVAMELDVEKFWDMLIDAIAALGA